MWPSRTPKAPGSSIRHLHRISSPTGLCGPASALRRMASVIPASAPTASSPTPRARFRWPRSRPSARVSITKRHGPLLVGLHLATRNDISSLQSFRSARPHRADLQDLRRRHRHRDALQRAVEQHRRDETDCWRPGSVDLSWNCLAGGSAFRRQATEYVLGALVRLSCFLLPNQRQLSGCGFILVTVRRKPLRPAARLLHVLQLPGAFRPVRPRRSRFRPARLNTRHARRMIHSEGLALNSTLAVLRRVSAQRAVGNLVDDVRQLVKMMLADAGAPSRETIAGAHGHQQPQPASQA